LESGYSRVRKSWEGIAGSGVSEGWLEPAVARGAAPQGWPGRAGLGAAHGAHPWFQTWGAKKQTRGPSRGYQQKEKGWMSWI